MKRSTSVRTVLLAHLFIQYSIESINLVVCDEIVSTEENWSSRYDDNTLNCCNIQLNFLQDISYQISQNALRLSYSSKPSLRVPHDTLYFDKHKDVAIKVANLHSWASEPNQRQD